MCKKTTPVLNYSLKHLLKTFHVSDCEAALKAVEDNLKRLKVIGGFEWFRVSSKEDLKCFNDVVDPIIEKYSMPKKLPIAMAEGDDDYDDDNMIDGGNSQIRLLELLSRLLN